MTVLPVGPKTLLLPHPSHVCLSSFGSAIRTLNRVQGSRGLSSAPHHVVLWSLGAVPLSCTTLILQGPTEWVSLAPSEDEKTSLQKIQGLSQPTGLCLLALGP